MEKFSLGLFYDLKEQLFGPEQKRRSKKGGWKKYWVCPACKEIELEISKQNRGYTCHGGCSGSEVYQAAQSLYYGSDYHYEYEPKQEQHQERPKGESRPFNGLLDGNHPEVKKLAERYGISEILARLNFGYSSDSKALEEFLGYYIDRGVVSRCGAGLNNQNQVRALRKDGAQWLTCKSEVTGERKFFTARLPGNVPEYRELYQKAREDKNLNILFTEGLGKTLSLVENTKMPVYGAEGVNNLLSKKEFKELTSDRSQIIFAFDSDSNSNWNVARAELRAGKKAIDNGTQQVIFWKWNPELGKGFDDLVIFCRDNGKDWRDLITSYDFETYLLKVEKIFPEKVREWKKECGLQSNFWQHTHDWATTKAKEIKSKLQTKLDAALTPKSKKPEVESSEAIETIEYLRGKLSEFAEGGKLIEYKGSDRLTIWAEAARRRVKNIVDSSGVGSGKSHAAGNLKTESLGVERIIYLSSQHRNPATKSLGNWEDLPSRHSGLVADKTRKNPDGSPKTRLPRQGENPNICGNCKYARKFNEAIESNLDKEETKAICRACEFGKKTDDQGNITSNLCATGEGDGYGFKFQRWIALQSPYLRAHIASLPSPEDDFFAETALFVDEAEAEILAASGKEVVVTESKLKNTFADLEISNPELFNLMGPVRRSLYELLKKIEKKEIGRHGKNDKDLRIFFNYQITANSNTPIIFLKDTDEALEVETKVSKALAQNLEKEIANKGIEQLDLKPQWLADFLRILKNPGHGSFNFTTNGSLVLKIKNPRIKAIFSESKFNIFADATANTSRLIDLLNLEKSETLICRERPMDHSNLHAIQIDFEREIQAGDRSNELQDRINAALSEIETRHPKSKRFNRKQNAEEGDLIIYADNRGVNHAENSDAIAEIGDVFLHRGAIASDYQAIYGRSPELDGTDEDFESYYLQRCQAEIIQMVGRLRSGRREENVAYYHLGGSKHDLGFLLQAFPGCRFERLRAGDFCVGAALKDVRSLAKIIEGAIDLVKNGQKLTQVAIANQISHPQNFVSRWIAKLVPGGWKFLKTLLSKLSIPLLRESYREMDKNEKALESLSPEELEFLRDFLEPSLDAAFAGGEIDGDMATETLRIAWEKYGDRAPNLFGALDWDKAANLLIWLFALLGIDIESLSPTDGLPLWQYQDMVCASHS